MRKGAGDSNELTRIFDGLKGHAERVLKPKIQGEPRAEDAGRRNGLTIAEALELEVTYRALYLSNRKAIDNDASEVGRVVSEYRALQESDKLDLRAPIHQDYLRDKMKRIVKERAALLCRYEESRDQHGGVRPDNVLLATIDRQFEGTTVARALTADTGGVKWVTDGWNNPHQIIFYRAVLNVPLYVFGRLSEMKDFYYRFKNMSKRSKVLHIDKNWEETLPDLDPDTAQEKHRQGLLRAHVINFATLQRIRDDRGTPYIIHRDGRFWLRDPNAPFNRVGLTGDDQSLAPLGETISASIERLPEVMEAERVKYMNYQQLLTAVHGGRAPLVLKEIAQLPLEWRRSRDELRTQYGSSPTPLQQARLKDFTDAFSRLHEALLGLLEKLRNLETERQTVGGEVNPPEPGIGAATSATNLRQSIDILRSFAEGWRALEQPGGTSVIPGTFESLFRPLNEKELLETTQRLKSGAKPSPASQEQMDAKG
jgi:hypothetical protein